MILDLKQVKALRQKRQWTQEQLAEMCNVSLRTIQRLESSGKASTETARALASVFEVDIESLILTSAPTTDKNYSPLIAIHQGFARYADFNGTASRQEYWWFFTFIALILAIAITLSTTLFTLLSIIVALPLIAAGTRRLNETGESGWWQLLALVPFGIFVVFYLLAVKNKSSDSDRFDRKV